MNGGNEQGQPMVAFPVNPDVLIWAREERRLPRAEAAQLLEITEFELYQFEIGEELPSITLLRKMADKYQITFGALLMPQPLLPTTRPTITDHRTHGGETAEISHQLMVELEDMNQLLDTMVELRDEAADLFTAPELPRLSTNDSVPTAAKAERERLGVTAAQQIEWQTASEAFQRWRSIIQKQGVFVYLLPLGDATNCRGFTIFDTRDVPVIVINNDEVEPAWRIFTLIHEYAHLLIRRPGITDERGGSNQESFCNRFAAYFLMPPDEFKHRASMLLSVDGSWPDSSLTRLASLFKTSRTATAFHLEELDLVGKGYGYRIWQRYGGGSRDRTGGPQISWEKRRLNRLGERHVDIVLGALERGRINSIDAYELLRVKPSGFPTLREEAAKQKAAYGATR